MVERGGDCCFEPVEKDAVELKAAFEVVLEYWNARGGPQDAIRAARGAVEDRPSSRARPR